MQLPTIADVQVALVPTASTDPPLSPVCFSQANKAGLPLVQQPGASGGGGCGTTPMGRKHFKLLGGLFVGALPPLFSHSFG